MQSILEAEMIKMQVFTLDTSLGCFTQKSAVMRGLAVGADAAAAWG